jgi:hypothetical protein
MAGNKIEVVIDVKTEKVTFAGGEVKNLRQQAKLLNDELQRTKAGTKEYQLLVEAIGDVEDATRRAKTATQEIYGTLGALPGPIGDITNNANKMVDTFKTLGTLKTTEIRAQFVNLGKDLKDAGQGLLNLIGFTKLYEANLATLTGAKAKDTVVTTANTQATELSTVAQEESTVATVADTAAKEADTTATVTASAATRAFAMALAALPFVAIIAGITALVVYWDKLVDAMTGATDISKTYKEAQKEVTTSVKDFEMKLYDVEDAFKAAKAGTMSKKKALEEYNEKLGDTVGYASSLDEAERLMAKNTPTVIESIKLRAQAQVFYAKSAEMSAQIVSGEIKDLSFWEGFTARLKDWVKGNAQNVEELQKNQREAEIKEGKRKEEETKKKVKALEEEGDKLTKQAIENDKKLQGSREKPDVVKKDDKTVEERKKALEDIAKAEADAFKETLVLREKEIYEVNQKYSALEAEAIKYGKDTKILEEARLASLKKLTDKYAEEDKKKAEEKEKVAKDNANKLLDIQKSLNDSTLNAMKTGTAKEKAEAKASGEDKIAAFKKQLQEAQDLKLLTAEEVAMKLAEFTKNVNDAIQNQIDDVDKKDLSKKLDDKLKLLQIQSEGLLAGTQAYFDNRRAIIDASEQKELENTELTEEAKTAIQKKYAEQRKQLRQEEVASIGQTISATIDALAAVTTALASGYDEEAKTSQEAFEKRKKLQVATAVMSAASGIVQILTQPSTLPSPFDWIVKGINAVALGIATAINIKKINATQFQAPNAGAASSTAASAPTGSKFADGGLLMGPSHSEGGIKTRMGELEGGEYVINRRSTASFLPMLHAINSAGKRKYAEGGMAASMDQLQTIMANQATPIVKTYVVASDVYSQAQADKKIADLARL